MREQVGFRESCIIPTMEIHHKLARALMRRRYERVGRSYSESEGLPMTSRVEKGKGVVDETRADVPAIYNPKKFTVLSSSNDVVDEAWLNAALRRTIAEGRLNVISSSPQQVS